MVMFLQILVASKFVKWFCFVNRGAVKLNLFKVVYILYRSPPPPKLLNCWHTKFVLLLF